MTVRITLGGSYPRKEELVKATWNADKGLLTPDGLETAEDAAFREVLQLQERFGFAPWTDGLLRWQDAFRPIVATTGGFEVGGVTRLFQTNRFYRQPILHSAPKLDWKKLEPYFPHAHAKSSAGWKAVLPSPYWFTRAAKNDAFGAEAELGGAVAGLLNQVARKLDGLGYREVQFNEPLLLDEAEPDLDLAQELFTAALAGIKAETTVSFPNGNAKPRFEFLRKVPASNVGIDFVETLVEDLPSKPLGTGLLAQVVDSQESLLETPEQLRDLSARITKRLRPTRLAFTHTWDLQFVPHEVAQKKLEVLSSLRALKEVVA